MSARGRRRVSRLGLGSMRGRKSRARSGFSMVELMITTVVLAVGIAGLASSMLGGARLDSGTRETAVAVDAARAAAERLATVPFGQVFETFGPGGAENQFAVAGLPAASGGGPAGQFVFPTVGGQLREDVFDAKLGMPRDLNGDGDQDNLDHSGDYVMLPVRVRIQWQGVNGERHMDLELLLVE